LARTNLRDDQWERIADILPGKETDPGRTGADNRRFVDAVLWLARAGAPWRDLPPEFGKWNSVYRRFSRWQERGVWERVFEGLTKDADFEDVFIDSTAIRVHQQRGRGTPKNGTQAISRSRGGLTTKLHALVDGLGNPARLQLGAGQAHDVTQAEPLLEGVRAEKVVADKAYDSRALINTIHQRGGKAAIPPRSNNHQPREFDPHVYQARNLVERFFNRIKHFRRVSTRYDKLDCRYHAFVLAAAILIWLA
jgi:transposase